MSKIQFDINVTIDVAYNILPLWWMEVYTLYVLTNQNHC